MLQARTLHKSYQNNKGIKQLIAWFEKAKKTYNFRYYRIEICKKYYKNTKQINSHYQKKQNMHLLEI